MREFKPRRCYHFTSPFMPTISSPDSPIRVLIVEDHYLARVAVASVIGSQDDMVVVGEAENGPHAVREYERLLPDLVLMDLRLPGLDGVGATAAICSAHKNAKVLLLSHYETVEDVRKALQAGAKGYLKKDVHGDELVRAIRLVYQGHRYVPVDAHAEGTNATPLTRRELQILEHAFAGKGNQDIALALGISEGTVRIHMSNVLHKLGVRRRAEAVAVALKRGLLRNDP